MVTETETKIQLIDIDDENDADDVVIDELLEDKTIRASSSKTVDPTTSPSNQWWNGVLKPCLTPDDIFAQSGKVSVALALIKLAYEHKEKVGLLAGSFCSFDFEQTGDAQ